MNYPPFEFSNLLDQIHIWTMDLDQWPAPGIETLQMLPENERAKSERFRYEILKTRYIKSRCALRLLLGMYHGTGFYDREFHINAYGKPSMKKEDGKDPICFNLSHSDNTCVFAFRRNGYIGVDVEKIKNLPDMESIAERFFSPLEKEKLLSLAESARKKSFFQYWTRKEALLKAMGRGLSFPPGQVEVLSDRNDPAPFFITTTIDSARNHWTITDIEFKEGFVAALVLDGRYPSIHSDIRLFRWSADIPDFSADEQNLHSRSTKADTVMKDETNKNITSFADMDQTIGCL